MAAYKQTIDELVDKLEKGDKSVREELFVRLYQITYKTLSKRHIDGLTRYDDIHDLTVDIVGKAIESVIHVKHERGTFIFLFFRFIRLQSINWVIANARKQKTSDAINQIIARATRLYYN